MSNNVEGIPLVDFLGQKILIVPVKRIHYQNNALSLVIKDTIIMCNRRYPSHDNLEFKSEIDKAIFELCIEVKKDFL
uniref:Glyco_tran_28_C domain-containing protein n=1 Tax=Strongyloides venezuelensis TaxID=75913 RepID=A0A0K0EX14_STRVS